MLYEILRRNAKSHLFNIGKRLYRVDQKSEQKIYLVFHTKLRITVKKSLGDQANFSSIFSVHLVCIFLNFKILIFPYTYHLPQLYRSCTTESHPWTPEPIEKARRHKRRRRQKHMQSTKRLRNASFPMLC
jgi:hypothetical protein